MPPKILTLGTKGGVPQALTNGTRTNKPILPQGPNLDTNEKSKVKQVDLLSTKELQESINSYQKSQFQAKAKDEEDKLPRFTIDSVKFSILGSNTLNKMKITLVSNIILNDVILRVVFSHFLNIFDSCIYKINKI